MRRPQAFQDARPRSALHVPLYADIGLLAQFLPSRVFRQAHRRRLKRGVFRSLVDLQAAIKRFLAEANDNWPFVWTANPDKIITAGRHGYQMIDSIHSRVRPSK